MKSCYSNCKVGYWQEKQKFLQNLEWKKVAQLEKQSFIFST